MAELIMPWLYMLLGPTILGIVAVKLYRYKITRSSASTVATALLLLPEGITIILLSILTGSYPLFDINTYRPLAVGLRGSMLPIALVVLGLEIALVMYYRRHIKELQRQEGRK